VEVAGLCHDLGHGPYSHLWECFVRAQDPEHDWEHEESSFKMLLLAIEENPDIAIAPADLDFIRELICGGDREKERRGEYPYSARGPDQFFLYEIISNKVTGIDVDKMDYMKRDAKALGLKTKFNFQRFVEAGEPRLVEFPYSASGPTVMRIAVREKVARDIQHLFQDRTDLHSTAYQHKTALVFNQMYVDTWALADPHLTVAGRDGALLRLSHACRDEVALARLTEGWIHQTIRNSAGPALAPARDLLRRIDQRRMYRIVAHIQSPVAGGGREERRSEGDHEAELGRVAAQGGLEPGDLAVTRVSINMGRTVHDRTGRSNPVERMLFYHKGSLEGYELGREALVRLVPQQTYDEQLYVLVRSDGDEAAGQAREAVRQWAEEGMGWQVNYL
jgi:hypothetical protein